MAAKFLQRSRHRTIFYFRRKIPADLADNVGAHQVYRSLRTTDAKHATIMARALAHQTDELFRALREMKRSKTGVRVDLKFFLEVDSAGKRRYSFEEIAPCDAPTINAIVAGLDPATSSPSPVREGGVTLRQALEAYKTEARLKPTSSKRYGPILDQAVSFLGETSLLTGITQERFAEFANCVKQQPGKANKTKNLYITVPGHFFRWCKSRYDGAPTIETSTLKFKREKPAREEADAFTLDEIELILRSLMPLEREPHKFWVTVLAAFTGARLEELAQFHLAEDLVQDSRTGAWLIRIGESAHDPHKSVKTLAGWRSMPLHSALVRHGLIDYLRKISAQGHVRPFPQWKAHKDAIFNVHKHGHAISKWGARHLAKLVASGAVRNAKLTLFKSMRHAFVNHLKQQQVPEAIAGCLVGHETGGITYNRYGKQFTDELLVSTVETSLEGYAEMLDRVMRRHGQGKSVETRISSV